MMRTNPALKVVCFQGLHTRIDGQEISSFPTVRTQALLAYLVVEQGIPIQRERLAGLLWPNEPERSARRSLSQTLLYLRQSLNDAESAISFFHATPRTLALNPESNRWVDVAAFEDNLEKVRQHDHRYDGPPGTTISQWVNEQMDPRAKAVTVFEEFWLYLLSN